MSGVKKQSLPLAPDFRDPEQCERQSRAAPDISSAVPSVSGHAAQDSAVILDLSQTPPVPLAGRPVGSTADYDPQLQLFGMSETGAGLVAPQTLPSAKPRARYTGWYFAQWCRGTIHVHTIAASSI